MKLRLLLTLITLCALTSFNTNAQSTFYTVSPFDPDFRVMDSTTMLATSTIPMTSTTGVVNGANGLASEPCDDVYIVYQVAGARYLGIIDPATAIITEIGSLGENVANITFVNGALLAVTGDGSSTPETLFSINVTTAAMTLVTPLGNGSDGESMEFNPDDGLLYHWSGWGTVVMETINPVTFAITPIALSGSALGNVGASTYVGNGRFLVSDINNTGLHYVTTSGFVTATSNTTDTFKGMVFADGLASITNTTAPNDSICAGETAVLVCNNTGVTYEWFLDGASTGNTNDTLNATVQGAYVCEIGNGTCTLPSDTIFLTVSNNPTTNITPSPSASICTGDSLELSLNTGGGPAGFQWYLDGTMIPGATNSSYFATTAGSYNATKTNQNGCTDSSAIATVIANNGQTVTLSPSGSIDLCPGDDVVLTLSGASSSTYEWAMNGTVIAGATDSTYTASAAGTYNATATNASGCSDSSAVSATISLLNAPNVVITPSPLVNFCAGDSVELSLNNGGFSGGIQWYMDGTAISGATSQSYFASAEGAYNATKTNMNGCSDSAAVATMLVDTCSNSIPELNGLSVTIYPNPASDIVKIDFDAFTNSDISGLQLVGLDGKVVRVFDIKNANINGISVNVSDVNTGIYFIRLTTNYGQIVKEVVIR